MKSYTDVNNGVDDNIDDDDFIIWLSVFMLHKRGYVIVVIAQNLAEMCSVAYIYIHPYILCGRRFSI